MNELRQLWRELVDNIASLQTPFIREAFEQMPRYLFVEDAMKEAAASMDRPLSIGEGQTVSQPYTVAMMLELLQPKSGDRVLDIGTGSGWQAALLTCCVGEGGAVVTVERIPELARAAEMRFRQLNIDIHSIEGNALTCPLPFDSFDIIVSAASSEELPERFVELLAPGGRLLHPVKDALRVVTKAKDGTLTVEDHHGFVFVPLVVD